MTGNFIGKMSSLLNISNLKKFKKRSEEHTSELQSRSDLVCRLLLEKKKNKQKKKKKKKADEARKKTILRVKRLSNNAQTK
mgnify:CR=1 FL=1